MDTATKSPLAARIGALAEAGIDFSSAPDEARTTLHSLRQEYPELRKFLEHRFARLSEAQQQMVLTLLEVAPAPDLVHCCSSGARASLTIAHTGRAIEVRRRRMDLLIQHTGTGWCTRPQLLDQLRTAEPLAAG